jgi:D-alanyl-D-alanine carboxypeptidase
MRSGLFEAYNTPELKRLSGTATPNMHFSARTLIGWAVRQKPYFAIRKAYSYSNTNYLLLGLIVESVTKHTVADEIRRRLLVPFQLMHTSYPTTQAMLNPWAHDNALEGGLLGEDPITTRASLMSLTIAPACARRHR